MILAVTGHRPERLGGYSPEADAKRFAFARECLERIQRRSRLEAVITGMAQGWDTAVAEACQAAGVPYWAYCPFPSQPKGWPVRAVWRWAGLLKTAQRFYYVSPDPYTPEKMQVRNRRMIDDAHEVLALWSGDPGGTANAVAYATNARKPVDNVWNDWMRFG